MPAYNAENFISETLESIFSQTYRPIEVLVIDDGSTDKTRLKIELFDVKYIYQNNQGPSQARNTGIVASKGEIIAFIDADDLWPADKLEIESNYLARNQHVDVVYGRVKYRMHSEAKKLYDRLEFANEFYDHFLLGSGLYRRRIFDVVGLFNTDLRSSEDLDWFLKLAENNVVMHRLEHISLTYRLSSHNLTADKNLKDLQVLEAIKLSLDRRRSKKNIRKLALPTKRR